MAKNSLHMAGKAVDIRLPGVSLADLRDADAVAQAAKPYSAQNISKPARKE